MATLAAGIGVAIVAYNKIKQSVQESIELYKAQEQATAKLNAAIKATGKEGQISLRAMTDFASGLQRVSLYGDEATIEAMGLLQSLADLDQQGVQKVTPAVLDFAAAMDVDLKTAANLVGKTIGSTTNALARYGIEIDATAPKEEKLIQLTEELNKKFGGTAQALSETSTGAMVQFQNVLGDLKEQGGRTIADFLSPLMVMLTDITANAGDAVRAMNDFREIHRKIASGEDLTIDEQLKKAQVELKGVEKGFTGLLLSLFASEKTLDRMRMQQANFGMEAFKAAREIERQQTQSQQTLKTQDLLVSGAKTLVEQNKKITEELIRQKELADKAYQETYGKIVQVIDEYNKKQEYGSILAAEIAEKAKGWLPAFTKNISSLEGVVAAMEKIEASGKKTAEGYRQAYTALEALFILYKDMGQTSGDVTVNIVRDTEIATNYMSDMWDQAAASAITALSKIEAGMAAQNQQMISAGSSLAGSLMGGLEKGIVGAIEGDDFLDVFASISWSDIGSSIGNIIAPGIGGAIGAAIGGAIDLVASVAQAAEAQKKEIKQALETSFEKAVLEGDFSQFKAALRNQLASAVIQAAMEAAAINGLIEEYAAAVVAAAQDGVISGIEKNNLRSLEAKLFGKYQDTYNLIKDFIPNTNDGGKIEIPSFAGGGKMKTDGLAYLHAGETVLNPQQSGSVFAPVINFNGTVIDGKRAAKAIYALAHSNRGPI